MAEGFHKGISHAAADDQRVAFVNQVGDNTDFIGNFRAAENRHKRSLRIFKRAADKFDFFLNQIAASCGQELRNTGCGGMRSVSGTERIVDIKVSKRSEFLGKLHVVLGFARLKADIFKKHDFAVFQRSGKFLRTFTDNVVCHFHFLTQKLRKTGSNRFHGKFGVNFPFRSAEVRAKDNLCAVFNQILNGGQRSNDSFIARNYAVLHFDVEVAANKDALALDVEIFHCHLVKCTHEIHPFKDKMIIKFNLVYFITIFLFLQDLAQTSHKKYWNFFVYYAQAVK